MRRKMNGFAAGLMAMSLAAAAPLTASAGAVSETQTTAITAETRAKKPDAGKQDKTDTTKPNKAQSQKAGKVTCTAAGKVNVSFKNKVVYTDNVRAVITDAQGNEIACKISKKNKNLLTVSVSGLVAGQTYTITIDGIVGKDTAEAVTITQSFVAKGMKTSCKTSKPVVSNNKFVTIKMNGSAYYKDAAVVVTDSDGNTCDAKIVKKAKGNIKIQITGMQKGKTYTITINGVKTKKEKNFGSITKTVTVK